MRMNKQSLAHGVTNENEIRVFEAMERLVEEDPDLCKCETCLLDVAAIALNKLPPRYRTSSFVSPPGGVLDLLPEEPKTGEDAIRRSVEEAVKEAIGRVKQHPSH